MAAVGTWSIVNLIFALLSALSAAYVLILRNNKKSWTLVSALIALVSIVEFILTENMSNAMGLTDKYTLIMAVMAIASLGSLIMNSKDEESETEEA